MSWDWHVASCHARNCHHPLQHAVSAMPGVALSCIMACADGLRGVGGRRLVSILGAAASMGITISNLSCMSHEEPMPITVYGLAVPYQAQARTRREFGTPITAHHVCEVALSNHRQPLPIWIIHAQHDGMRRRLKIHPSLSFMLSVFPSSPSI